MLRLKIIKTKNKKENIRKNRNVLFLKCIPKRRHFESTIESNDRQRVISNKSRPSPLLPSPLPITSPSPTKGVQKLQSIESL